MTGNPRHLCTGPDCWTCGEPAEIRQLRQHEVLSALYQLAQDHPGADHHRQARAAMDALRPTLMRWLHAEADLREASTQLAARDAEIQRLRTERDEARDTTLHEAGNILINHAEAINTSSLPVVSALSFLDATRDTTT